MPVLHTYRSKEGHYILAGVNGRIVTYRLSSEGARRLQDNRITDGEKFSWQVLLELIRLGDAYTSNASTDDEDLSGWTQLGLLFNIQENEPTSSDLVPLCSCGSMENLHIAELADTKTASLLCDYCRKSRRNQIDASVPIYMINTPPALDHLLERSGLSPDDSVTAYRELLNASLEAKWKSKIRPKVKTVQTGLFGEPEKTQQSLL
ncbi:MAG: hypothetical protein ACYDG4_08540 [Desulfuromonadaceae bacterium]